MAGTIKKFGFHVDKALTPVAYVTLNKHSILADGQIAITASMTALEIDTNIELLKADLDAVGKRAKAALQRARSAREA